jgi:exodeoxyribonuclease V gamma subunit
MSTPEPGTGIVVYRASRLEALLSPLESLLAQFPPTHLLGSQTVLAAHPGIKRWLRQALARVRGGHGIVANLDVQLPSAWLDARARDVLGVSELSQASYRRDALRWRLFALLPRSRDVDVQRYLANADVTRRFQLADHMAGLFTRYMVYRPDWLARWQTGDTHVPRANFLAPIWQRLRRDIAKPHRGELLQELAQALMTEAHSGDQTPLHVFGLSHLAPLELDVLRAEARHRLVVLYLPDPCVEFWAGIGNERGRMQRLAHTDDDEARERELLDLGHPLLAAWGRLGQHFGLSLSTGEGGVISETRHWRDSDSGVATDRLLPALQQSIRKMQPDLLDMALSAHARDDASLRIHGCHTRLRELEVLRDVMLDALRRDPGLHPSQMIVMSPVIGAYAALIPAVFGGAADPNSDLPYHLADVSLIQSHALFRAFAALLDLGSARVTTEQVLDLLAFPAIARALGLSGSALERLQQWLAEARVAWGIDANARARLGLPAYAEHSFAWGMQRLLAGYLYGDDQAAPGTSDAAATQVGSWPVDGVRGVEAEALGALDQLLGELDALARLAAAPRSLGQWCATLHGLIDRLLLIDPRDTSEREAHLRLVQQIEALRSGAETAGVDPELSFALLRELLQEQLDAVPERQPFLLGAATICGMVPQRSIPFRFIAVLGLNDGEFPRAASDRGIDLMTRSPRLGDRDVRSDDRYLFLETVMAARDQLHLSHVAEGARDGKPLNPAAPLAELIAFLDARARWSRADHDALAASPDAGKLLRPWHLRHALQPFDARYFSAAPDAMYFSYRRAFAAAPVAFGATADRFVPRRQVNNEHAPPASAIPLHGVLAYFKDPAKALLTTRMQLRLDALDEEAVGHSEALVAALPKRERVPRTLVYDALAAAPFAVPDEAPLHMRLAGTLPAGALAELAWDKARTSARAILAIAAQDPLLAGGVPETSPMPVALQLADGLLEGALEHVHRVDGRWLLLDVFPDKTETSLSFRQRLPLFVAWAALRLQHTDEACVLRVLCSNGPSTWATHLEKLDRETLRHRLEQLLAFWKQAQQRPCWYFPETSWAIARATPETRRSKAMGAWQARDGERGESLNAPGYAGWLARGVDLFDTGGADWAELEANALALGALIDASPSP